MHKVLKLPIKAKELLSYFAVFVFISIALNFEKALISSLFFFMLIRMSIYDIKYKLIPHVLILGSFLFSFIITEKQLLDSLKDGLMFTGGIFILGQILELLISYRNKDDEQIEVLGEGDIPIIGIMGVMFEFEVALSCLFTSGILGIIFYFYAKEKEMPFFPALSLSIFLHYIYNFSLINAFF